MRLATTRHAQLMSMLALSSTMPLMGRASVAAQTRDDNNGLMMKLESVPIPGAGSDEYNPSSVQGSGRDRAVQVEDEAAWEAAAPKILEVQAVATEGFTKCYGPRLKETTNAVEAVCRKGPRRSQRSRLCRHQR